MDQTTEKILQRVEKNIVRQYRKKRGYAIFHTRLVQYFPQLLEQLFLLYGNRKDFLYQVEDIIKSVCLYTLNRPEELQELDKKREAEPRWYLSEKMAGISFYVDLFAGSLKRVPDYIPYLKDLGITTVHIMPMYKSPVDENDGGYAVSSYRRIDKKYGSMADLEEVTRLFRENGMSLVLDFILNHTASNHEWALKARSGISDYKDYYYIFDNKTLVEEYNMNLRDIFPEKRTGSFSFCTDLGSWVWTTFNDYQWDLNYKNPVVFRRMLEEMLFLANKGVEILRFDALAFIWKEKGTGCENLPGAHTLIQAFKSAGKIAAPGIVFKSEAIVHPDDVRRYISQNECELSYNPLLMATLWESLATRKVELLKKSMETYAHTDTGCSWVNYVRCHDDIGWTFSDDDAWSLGINPRDHRRFLNDFYTGIFEGSFARGLPFQENKATGDARISGTCASLAGVEKALEEETENEVDLAVKRILLLYGVAASMNGFPLIYAGDEIGLLNNYQYKKDHSKALDSRWVHRQKMPWMEKNEVNDQNLKTPVFIYKKAGAVYQGIKKLIRTRKTCPVFASEGVEIIDTLNIHVFGFLRKSNTEQLLVLANFTEENQVLDITVSGKDILSGKELEGPVTLSPYQLVWLKINK